MPSTTPSPVDVVNAYHQAWTGGDVDRAMTYLAAEHRPA